MKRTLLAGEGRVQETRRLARVLDILQQLYAAPQQWTRKALAEKYEVGERQIQRDLEVIRYRLKLAVRRSRQGYYLSEAPRLPVVSYTFTEALALLEAAQVGREYGVDSAELGSAMGRLESVFPVEFRPLLRDLAAQDDGVGRSEVDNVLLTIHRALAGRYKVRLRYPSSGNDAKLEERVVRPYFLMPRNRSWYVVGHCEVRDAIRTFKVARIVGVELLPEHYRNPKDLSAEVLAGGAWGLMWGAAGDPETVRLEFSPEAVRWVAEEEWHPSQQVRLREDGVHEVVFRIGVTPECVRWLMWFGSDVRVLEPEWLREKLAAEHRAAAERLGSG